MNTTTHTNGHAKSTSVRTLMKFAKAKNTEMPTEPEVPGIEKRTIKITVVGQSQMIINAFGSKCRDQMEQDRGQTQEEKLALRKQGKKPITPAEIKAKWQGARILDSKGRDCIPSAWIKRALVTASKYKEIGVASKVVGGTLYVEGDLIPIVYKPRPASQSDDNVKYDGKGPGLRTDVVRVGKWGDRKPDLRYRPCFDDWSLTFFISFEPSFISLPSLYQLIRRAGTSVGLCEWRPEKNGQCGRFDIKAGLS
jgi:hypothetical protein